MKIIGFYFAALMLDNWYEIINEQINKLVGSELFKNTDKLYVRVFYNKESDLCKFKELFNDNPKIEITSTNKNEHEYGILKIIESCSNVDNFNCYYFHSKGVSITSETMKKHKLNISYQQMKDSIESWRRYMEYFLIDRYEDCIKNLDDGFDACGVQLRGTPRKDSLHFSGNFWWSKSEYINTLPDISELPLNFRWSAEFWIGSGDGKFKNFETNNNAGYLNRLNTIQTHHIHN